IDFDGGLLIPEQDQIQIAVPVEIGKLGRHIPVLSAENLFDEASAAIAQEGLHPPEVAGRHDVRESVARSEEHTSELQSRGHLVCRLLLEKKKDAALPALATSRASLHTMAQ